jgi:hypothetical protein
MSDETSGVKTFEQWVDLEKPEQWLVASARSAFRIPYGREMTREDFHAFLEKTRNVQMLPGPKSPEQKAEEQKREGPNAPTPNVIPEP